MLERLELLSPCSTSCPPLHEAFPQSPDGFRSTNLSSLSSPFKPTTGFRLRESSDGVLDVHFADRTAEGEWWWWSWRSSLSWESSRRQLSIVSAAAGCFAGLLEWIDEMESQGELDSVLEFLLLLANWLSVSLMVSPPRLLPEAAEGQAWWEGEQSLWDSAADRELEASASSTKVRSGDGALTGVDASRWVFSWPGEAASRFFVSPTLDGAVLLELGAEPDCAEFCRDFPLHLPPLRRLLALTSSSSSVSDGHVPCMRTSSSESAGPAPRRRVSSKDCG